MSKIEKPKINWYSFTDGKVPSIAPKVAALIIAIDTEYQSNYTANDNLLLSYQYSAYDLKSGKIKSGIFYPDLNKQERYSLSELLRLILKNMQINISSIEGYQIILVAHYFTAEWSMLKDRKELACKLEHIRKTMITTKPLPTTIIDEKGEKVNLYFDIKDTMLLLPDGYRALADASTFIEGYEKIYIDEKYKSNMYQFLQDEPALFKEYAIRDAEVTLKLFIKLQYLLNKINGTKDKLYSTLASATTNSFNLYSKKNTGNNVHKMQFDRLHSIYKSHEKLASRAYMGGLNSSYYIGSCDEYTFLDIDFKNAYPTAMNLLKISDFGEELEKRTASAPNLEGLKNA